MRIPPNSWPTRPRAPECADSYMRQRNDVAMVIVANARRGAVKAQRAAIATRAASCKKTQSYVDGPSNCLGRCRGSLPHRLGQTAHPFAGRARAVARLGANQGRVLSAEFSARERPPAAL